MNKSAICEELEWIVVESYEAAMYGNLNPTLVRSNARAFLAHYNVI